MKILVTGGLGFVGSNLVDMLVDEGHDVYVIDDMSSTSATVNNINKKATYYYGCVTKLFDLISVEHNKFDKIFHLAAKARIQPSFDEPLDYFKSNMYGTAVVMEFARLSKSGIVVYATTSSKNHGSPYITPYTYSKVAGEDILRTYVHCYNQNCAMATFYNVYGPREPKKGEWATVVAKFIRQAQDKQPLTVVGDGTQSRDFTHVEDICKGLIAISNGTWNAHNFDLGRGEPVTILELAKMISSNIKFVPLRKNEGMHTESEWKKTETMLGWRAKNNLSDYIKNIIS